MYLLQHLITWPEIGQGRWQDSESAIIHTGGCAHTHAHTHSHSDPRIQILLFEINILMTQTLLAGLGVHARRTALSTPPPP